MSSILKALKKLEEEKAQATGGQVNLARDILRGDGERRPAPLKFALLVLVLITLGGLAGMAVLTWLDTGPRPLQLSDPGQQGGLASEPRLAPSPDPRAVRPSGAVRQNPAAPREHSASAPGVPSPPEPAAPAMPPDAAPVKPGTPVVSAKPPREVSDRPTLTVSGIVYQADAESRMAVINDLPTMVGTRIAGALVEEIRPESVVFSYRGERFEVFFVP